LDQKLISYQYSSSWCCFCCHSICWGTSSKKSKAPSFQIGSCWKIPWYDVIR